MLAYAAQLLLPPILQQAHDDGRDADRKAQTSCKLDVQSKQYDEGWNDKFAACHAEHTAKDAYQDSGQRAHHEPEQHGKGEALSLKDKIMSDQHNAQDDKENNHDFCQRVLVDSSCETDADERAEQMSLQEYLRR